MGPNNGDMKFSMNVPDLSKPQVRMGVSVNVLAATAKSTSEQLLREQEIEQAKQSIAEIMMRTRIFRVDAFLAFD